MPALNPAQQRRLAGRHGRQLGEVLRLIDEVGGDCVAGTNTLWAELAWAAEGELVLHLDDLLLRRTRLGLLLAEGGRAELPHIRALCQPRLGWSDARWQQEETCLLYTSPADGKNASIRVSRENHPASPYRKGLGGPQAPYRGF